MLGLIATEQGIGNLEVSLLKTHPRNLTSIPIVSQVINSKNKQFCDTRSINDGRRYLDGWRRYKLQRNLFTWI